MILVIGGIKGGSGKSTLATNIAVIRSSMGKRVLLVDADEQLSASDWSEHRESRGIATPWTTVRLSGSAIRTQILKMGDNYDDFIIDTGGRDTTSQRSALTIADKFLAPFQPRSLDIWTLNKVSDLVEGARAMNPRLTACAVINRADAKGSDNKDTAEILKECAGLHLLPVLIGQRKAFSNAAAEGLGVTELKVIDKKADSEIRYLCKILFASEWEKVLL